MRFFLIAGEASGDLHAAALIAQIKQHDPKAQFSGLGGDQMAAAECRLYQHYSHMAFMGFAAVLRNLGQVRRNFRIAQEALLAEKPDALILIDYPSFNLRMASFCRTHLPDTKIYYYIPPKVWAWKRRRIHTIARLCDKVLGIFPFEPDFYAQYGYECVYVGNPTAEEIDRYTERTKNATSERTKTIAVLPGSRESEVKHCLPRMLEAARRFPDYRIVVSAAQAIDDNFYTPYLKDGEQLTRNTYPTLQQAQVAIVNSGTATLETALLGCPQVAVYHLAWSRFIGLIRSWGQPMLFSIPYFTLVNIIAGKEVIKECVANEFTVSNVENEIRRILTDDAYKTNMLASYEHIHSILCEANTSSAAELILTDLYPARN